MQLTLVLTHACNLRCTYCYTGEKKAVRMPAATGRRAIDFALEQRPEELVLAWFGGEPLLEWGLLQELAGYAAARTRAAGVPFRQIMTTNGTLLSDDVLAELAGWPIELTISLDGIGAAHDVVRPFADGRGSYAVVADALERARRRFPDVIVLMVVDPANAGALSGSLAALAAQGARRLRFTVNFLAEWSARDRAVLGEELARAADLYVEGFRRGDPVSIGPFDDRLRVHLRGGATAADHCDMGGDEIAVAPSGWIYPCERMVGEDTDLRARIGHVDTGFDPARRAAFRDAGPAAPSDMAARGLPACGMFCGCTNWFLTGQVGEVPGAFREYQERLVKEALRAGTTLFAERNPWFLGLFYGEEDLLARAIAGREGGAV